MKQLIFSLAIGALLAAPLPGRADIVIYNSFGQQGNYDIRHGAGVHGPDSPFGLFASGFRFVPSTTLSLDSVQLAVSTMDGANAFSLRLQAADGNGGAPGSVLESFLVTGQMQNFGFANPLISVTSATQPVLEAGKTYWLVAAGEQDAWAAWNLSPLGLSDTYYSIQGGNEVLLSGQPVAAFRINGTLPVPEPGGGLLLLLGLSVWACKERFSQRRNRDAKDLWSGWRH